MPKIVILRGNSGSGKTSTTVAVRKAAKDPRSIAIIEQDYLRRSVLKEKETENGNNIELIKANVEFCLKHGYDVIIEGILRSDWNGKMLKSLLKNNDENYVYYLDVSFEETLRRHQSKPNAHEFGEKEMREWFIEKDYLDIDGEEIIPEDVSQNELVKRIISDTAL